MTLRIKINHLNPYADSFCTRWKVFEWRSWTWLIIWTYYKGVMHDS